MPVLLYACFSAAPTGLISVKFVTGDVNEKPSRNPRFDENPTKFWGTLREDLTMFYSFRRHNFAMEAFLFKPQYFYIVDSGVYVNNTHITLFIFIATVVTRRSHSVKLYVHFLSCFFYMSAIFISEYAVLNNALIYVSA
jgi:hypothetical protein